jgi:hypothetical protein
MPSWTIESFNHSRGFVKDQSKYEINFIFVLNIHPTLSRRYVRTRKNRIYGLLCKLAASTLDEVLIEPFHKMRCLLFQTEKSRVNLLTL